tara:strand:+ start:2047 stop:2505 length:459 start_codon:yes stop_codon:yes gene_type:complete
MNKDLYIIAHNIRSLYNIGTIFRTADALGVKKLFLTGYSGYPPRKEITKVALGAEESLAWKHYQSLNYLLKKLKKEKINVIALENSRNSLNYLNYKPRFPLALIVGNEVRGISSSILKNIEQTIFLPMQGLKESLNVGVAMAVAGYYIISKK